MFLFYFFPSFSIKKYIDHNRYNIQQPHQHRYTIDIYVNPESFGRLKHASKMVSRYQSNCNMPQPTTGLKADKMSNKY